jgi:hypothetical protein
MKQNELAFESENLVVDWISFKFQFLENNEQIGVAHYLSKLGFDSYQESGKLAKPIKEAVQLNPSNKFEVIFVKGGPYWEGTTLQFSGSNATRFYNLVQKKLVNWKNFSSATLGRFDLYYYRNNKSTDKISSKDFLENCQRELKQTNKNFSLEKNRKGWILKIGSRRSNNYFRIYETQNSLKFEHEMKGEFLQKHHLFLVSNTLDEFEQKLSSHFLVYLGKLLPLNYSHLDWLAIKLRPIRKRSILQYGLNLHYVQKSGFQLFNDRKNFISLLQFLVYAKTLDYKIGYLEPTYYRLVTFRVQDFFKFQNPTVKSTNYYQLKKLIQFFDELQANSLIKSFTDNRYRSLVTIPEVNLQKSKQNCWVAKVWVSEELFRYTHPFLLPDFFQQKLTKDEFEVQFKVIQIFSSITIVKEFFIQEFLDSYPSVLSNQRRTKIKRLFIQSVKLFQQYDLIEPDYKVISDGYYCSVEELTIYNISEGFVLHEKLSI